MSVKGLYLPDIRKDLVHQGLANVGDKELNETANAKLRRAKVRLEAILGENEFKESMRIRPGDTNREIIIYQISNGVASLTMSVGYDGHNLWTGHLLMIFEGKNEGYSGAVRDSYDLLNREHRFTVDRCI